MKISPVRNYYSFFATIITIVIMVLLVFLNPSQNPISFDVFGYYLYLPATFIFHDISFTDLSQVNQIVDLYHNTTTLYQLNPMPDGQMAIRYSMGMAFLYLPFFLIAHVIAIFSQLPADGFSEIYQQAMIAEYVIWSITGLFFLRKVLLEFFNDKLVAILVLLVFFGTNYLHNACYSISMPHGFLFALYAILLWLTIKWHKSPKTIVLAAIAFVIGLMVIARPTEIVCVLIPLLWGVENKKSFIEKINKIWREKKQQLIVASVVFLLLITPQVLYWWSVTGNVIYNGYSDNPGEGLDFFRPHTIKALFSFRKGWLIYTPIMIFGIVGFYHIYKKRGEIFWALFIYFVLNLYTVTCWSNWWYADSFGQRAIVQSYPVMIIALGFFMQAISQKHLAIKSLIIALTLFFISLNLFQTRQINKGVLDSARMTRAYYFRVFGEMKATDDDRKLLLVNRSFDNNEKLPEDGTYSLSKRLIEDFENIDNTDSVHLCDSIKYSGRYSFILDSSQQYSPGFNLRYKDISKKDHFWVRAKVYVYPLADLEVNPASLVIHFQHKGGTYKYNAHDMEKYALKAKQWNLVTVDYITPEVRSFNDRMLIYCWLQGNSPLLVDKLEVDIYEKK